MARKTQLVYDNTTDATLRLSLGTPDYGSTTEPLRQSMEIGTGARALWVGRKYVVLMTYSQWVDVDGNRVAS